MDARWLDGPPDDATLRALASAGVRAIALPLHGARAQVHEWVAGALDPAGGAGSFAATLGALDASRGLGLRRAAWTRLTRSNARVIGELASLLEARRVELWVIEISRPSGDAWTSVVPRFGLSIPSALAAMERARSLGVSSRILGAPRCVLGRYADRALPAEGQASAAVCDGCPSRAVCPGVAPGYLERFGASELRHAPRLAPAPSPLFDRLARAGRCLHDET